MLRISTRPLQNIESKGRLKVKVDILAGVMTGQVSTHPVVAKHRFIEESEPGTNVNLLMDDVYNYHLAGLGSTLVADGPEKIFSKSIMGGGSK